jgi:hypothetical protein
MSVPRQFLRFAVRYLSSADIVEVLIARSFELPLQEFGRDSQLYKNSAFPALAAMISYIRTSSIAVDTDAAIDKASWRKVR